MIEPANYDTISIGGFFLCLDPTLGAWDLWQKGEQENDYHFVTTGGAVRSEPRVIEGAWPAVGYVRMYPVTEQQADACVMAARHLPDADSWCAFADRMVGREAS